MGDNAPGQSGSATSSAPNNPGAQPNPPKSTATNSKTTTQKETISHTLTLKPGSTYIYPTTALTTVVTRSGLLFTTTTPGYFTIATYESSLYYYTTSGNHKSIVCTETLTQETVLKVTASNEDDAQSSFTSMLHSIEKQAKPTHIPITKDTVVPCSGTSGLSAGEKAGIGVGASIGGLLIIGLMFFLFWRRRKRQQREGGRAYVDAKAELEGDPARAYRKGEAKKGAAELEGRDIAEAPQKVEEIGDRTSRYELEGNWRGNELR
jgi:hypothetical protein